MARTLLRLFLLLLLGVSGRLYSLNRLLDPVIRQAAPKGEGKGAFASAKRKT